MTATRRIIILIGLALFLVIPDLGLTKHLPTVPGYAPMIVREWFWWGLLALGLFYVLVVERRSLASIGLRAPTWKTFAFGFLAAVVAVVGIGLLFTFVLPALQPKGYGHSVNDMMQTPFWYRFFVVTRAALMEETLFRGYGIERLNELTGSKWVAGLLSWAAFTFAHLSYWGWGALIIAGYGGLVLTLLYLWRRDLVCNMICHWLTDGAGFLLPH